MEQQNDIEKCLDEIDRLKTAYAKQKAENNLLKQTINGYIADQGIWINGCQCAQKENEQLKEEIKRLTEEKGKYQEKWQTSYMNKLNLQKQVDELKEELVKAYITERANIQAEIADAGTSCHWCQNVTIKNTANKIYQGLCIYKNFCKMKDAILWGNESEELKDLISKIVGMEVE